MNLKGTRKLLSIILVVFIAISTLCYNATFVIANTMGSQKFVSSHIVTADLVAACEKQLDVKFDVLEQKSGIPARVFQMVKKSFNTHDAMVQAAQYLFDVNDSTLYNDTKVEYFSKICIEYLQGNNIEYKQENVDNVAREAAKIYSDCVGIHNADGIKHYVASTSRICSRIQSVCALITLICAVLIILMYSERVNAYIYASAGLIAGGFATLIGSLISFAIGIGADYSIAPSVYLNSFNDMTKTCVTFIMLLGLAVIVLGTAFFAACMYKISVENNRKETRFSKVVVKL